jgi:hypothetical protein
LDIARLRIGRHPVNTGTSAAFMASSVPTALGRVRTVGATTSPGERQPANLTRPSNAAPILVWAPPGGSINAVAIEKQTSAARNDSRRFEELCVGRREVLSDKRAARLPFQSAICMRDRQQDAENSAAAAAFDENRRKRRMTGG